MIIGAEAKKEKKNEKINLVICVVRVLSSIVHVSRFVSLFLSAATSAVVCYLCVPAFTFIMRNYYDYYHIISTNY